VLQIDDASGVKAAQRDQGEARRSGVISRLLRRIRVPNRQSHVNEPGENVTGL